MNEGRYRLYRVAADRRAPELVASTDSAEGVGLALITLAEEGEFDGARLGVLDRPEEDKPGRWIVNPYAG